MMDSGSAPGTVAASGDPSATIVICTRNRPARLETCLQAVRRLNYPKYQICVVDNAPDDDAARVMAGRYGAEYELAPIRGLSRARNLGVLGARGEIVAFLDDDMVPHDGWLRALALEFQDERVMAVSGPVLPLTMADAAPGELARALVTRPRGTRKFQLDRNSAKWFERVNFGGFGDGNMAFRRRAFEEFPGFDERLGRGVWISGGEEHYAYFTLVKRGHRLAYAPAAIVFHPDAPRSVRKWWKSRFEAVAYFAFLAACEPRYAWRVAKYLLEALLGRKRSWRMTPTEAEAGEWERERG